MKNLLYIGIYSSGSTSRMRGEILKNIFQDWSCDLIDTDIPFKAQNRISRSIGFRYKKGPTISAVNAYVLQNLQPKQYDLIWVDKAIFLTEKTTETLRKTTHCMVHYTPDPAFSYHQSKYFFASLKYYDFLITTKIFEIEAYKKSVETCNTKVLYVTQGFDKSLHHPVIPFEKKKGVVFIGHFEKERAVVLQELLNSGISVTLAGIKWSKFVNQNRQMPLNYLGTGIFGEKYVEAISSGLFALGSVSKWIPEKHTTRTFEIPACGTALLTEKNEELTSFFQDDEVIYYNNTKELIDKIHYYNTHINELEQITERGTQKVNKAGFDYESILKNVLKNIL